MTRKLVFGAAGLLMVVATAQAAVVYPTLVFTTADTTTVITKVQQVRMISSTDAAATNNWYADGSGVGHLLPVAVGLSGKYVGSGTWASSANFTLTPSTNTAGVLMALDTYSGTFLGAVPTPTSLSLGWSSVQLLTPGAKSGTVTAVDISAPTTVKSVLTVSGAVLDDRHLTANTIGTTAAPVRLMPGVPTFSFIRSGTSALVDGDNYATRVNTVNGSITDTNGIKVGYVQYLVSGSSGPSLKQYNAPNQSNKIFISSTSASGVYTGSINVGITDPITGVGPMLSNGETGGVGAVVLPAMLNYNVDMLEQRQLIADGSGVAALNLLKGVTQVSGYWELDSANLNPDHEHCTSVYINKMKSQTVTSVNGDKFVLSAYGTAVTSGDPVLLPYHSTVLKSGTAYGSVTIGGSGVIQVTSAEAASVGDTTPYAPVPFSITLNVGNATLGLNTGSFTGASTLYATVAAGTTWTSANSSTLSVKSLSSRVTGPYTLLGSNGTLMSLVTGKSDLLGWDGPVGSEAVIAAAGASTFTSTSNVTMAWRSRTGVEAANLALDTPPDSPTLADDITGLVSDVVQISGIGTSGVYALQLSFDGRIGMALNGTAGGVQHLFDLDSLFPVEVDPMTNAWVKASDLTLIGTAGIHAQPQQWDSLADFLYKNRAYSLESLLGSWGVDPAVGATGLAHAWVITKGSGTFAVVPEPSTIVLLVSATGIGVGGLWRLRKGKKERPALKGKRR
jgi:hypothetical protein